MIRKRFPASRVGRITGWTALTTAWVAAGIARFVGGPAAAEPAPVVPEPAPVSFLTEASAEAAPIPTLPDEGLVILRYTPTPPPPPVQRIVERVVVRRVVSGSPAVASSGS